MIRQKHRAAKERGADAFRVSWFATIVIVIVGVGFGSRDTLTDWVFSEADRAVAGELRSENASAGSLIAERLSEANSEHVMFGIQEEQPPVSGKITSLEGRWVGRGQPPGSLESPASDCRYSVRSIDFRLREDAGRVYGYGTYSLAVDACSSQSSDITEYVAISGRYDRPRMQLAMTNATTGRIELEYHGTVHEGEITGEVKSPDGELHFEEVSLTQF